MQTTTRPSEARRAEDTIVRDRDAASELPPPRPDRPRVGIGATIGWIAVIAGLVAAIWLVVAVSADRGSETVPASLGSDQHLHNQAADLAAGAPSILGSDQHLHNQADAAAPDDVTTLGSDVHLHNLAAQAAAAADGGFGSDQHLHNLAGEGASR